VASASARRSDAAPVNWSVMASPRSRSAVCSPGSTASTSRQIDSASPGSFSSRYQSALAVASGIASLEMVFNWCSMTPPSSSFPTEDLAQELRQRVVEVVDDALLQRNDRVVRDVDVLGADLGAALGDVAVAEAQL